MPPTIENAMEEGVRALRLSLREAQRARTQMANVLHHHRQAMPADRVAAAEHEIHRCDRVVSCITLGLSNLPADPVERLRHLREVIAAAEQLSGLP